MHHRLTTLVVCCVGLAALPSLCVAQGPPGVELSKAGIFTRAAHTAGFLFFPKRLKLVQGVYAYPATADNDCRGENLEANGLGVVINGSKGRLWNTLSDAGIKQGNNGLCIPNAGAAKGEREVLSGKLLRGVNPTGLYFVDLTNNTFYKSRASVALPRIQEQN